MDRIIQDGEKLGPKDRAERVALFRVQVIGPLLARDFQDHGELADEIRAIAAKHHRPPGTSLGRQYSAPTIERWYYEYRHGGLEALRPRRRSDTGHARELTEEQRALLLDIRREHPRATASVILRTLELDGRLEKGTVSPSTLRRLYQEHGLDRLKADAADGRIRLRWQADRADALWHSDVCHGPAMTVGERTWCVINPTQPTRPTKATGSTRRPTPSMTVAVPARPNILTRASESIQPRWRNIWQTQM
jgi:transposase